MMCRSSFKNPVMCFPQMKQMRLFGSDCSVYGMRMVCLPTLPFGAIWKYKLLRCANQMQCDTTTATWSQKLKYGITNVWWVWWFWSVWSYVCLSMSFRIFQWLNDCYMNKEQHSFRWQTHMHLIPLNYHNETHMRGCIGVPWLQLKELRIDIHMCMSVITTYIFCIYIHMTYIIN